jgi:glycerophosphoryl diester phosphodiesterase
MVGHKPLVFAHRGASTVERQNTIAAFRAAAAQGADGVELDVRLLADGSLAVHHDVRLPDGRALAVLRRAELPPEVPLLHEALAACGDLIVNVEVKNSPRDPDHDPARGQAGGVVQAIQAAGASERVIVSSFDLGMVDAVRELAPAIPVGWLVSVGLRGALLRRCMRHGLGILHPWDRLVTPAFVSAARSQGLRLNVWTVNDPARMRRLAAWGVAGVITDLPAVARAALDEG